MADEQLKQQKIVKNKAIEKSIKNIAHAPVKHVEKKENKRETNDKEIQKEKEAIESKEDNKTESENKTEKDNKEEKSEKEEQKPEKKEAKIKIKKTEAVVYGKNVPISLKHAVAIGRFIKNLKIDEAIANLEKVKKKKMAVPFKGEIAHRKGKRLDGRRMMSGKYPVKSSQHIIQLLKTLKANSSVNGLELESTKITEVIPNKASKQLHRFGSTQFKRIHIMIKAKEVVENKQKEQKKKSGKK